MIFQMNRQYEGGDDPFELYDAEFDVLGSLAPPWGLEGIQKIPMVDHRGAITLGVKYSKLEKASPVKSIIFGFMSRKRTGPPPDTAVSDDTLTVEFYPKKVHENWNYLFDTVFTTYILAARPYFARLYDDQIHANDVGTFDEELGQIILNPSFIDWRRGVYRVWPANFWNREYCRRSFNLEPEAIVERLTGKVEHCRVFEDGVLLICAYRQMNSEEIMMLNDAVLPHLLG
jgi:hypothetical protein